jgi:hypothetical protein
MSSCKHKNAMCRVPDALGCHVPTRARYSIDRNILSPVFVSFLPKPHVVSYQGAQSSHSALSSDYISFVFRCKYSWFSATVTPTYYLLIFRLATSRF